MKDHMKNQKKINQMILKQECKYLTLNILKKTFVTRKYVLYKCDNKINNNLFIKNVQKIRFKFSNDWRIDIMEKNLQKSYYILFIKYG